MEPCVFVTVELPASQHQATCVPAFELNVLDELVPGERVNPSDVKADKYPSTSLTSSAIVEFETKNLDAPLTVSNKPLTKELLRAFSHTKSGLNPNPEIVCVLPLPV
jgi:hypothetical protein